MQTIVDEKLDSKRKSIHASNMFFMVQGMVLGLTLKLLFKKKGEREERERKKVFVQDDECKDYLSILLI